MSLPEAPTEVPPAAAASIQVGAIDDVKLLDIDKGDEDIKIKVTFPNLNPGDSNPNYKPNKQAAGLLQCNVQGQMVASIWRKMINH